MLARHFGLITPSVYFSSESLCPSNTDMHGDPFDIAMKQREHFISRVGSQYRSAVQNTQGTHSFTELRGQHVQLNR